ncbi:MAG: hypothetical protein AABZ46_05995, partial [Nitrospirota bacterium]
MTTFPRHVVQETDVRPFVPGTPAETFGDNESRQRVIETDEFIDQNWERIKAGITDQFIIRQPGERKHRPVSLQEALWLLQQTDPEHFRAIKEAGVIVLEENLPGSQLGETRGAGGERMETVIDSDIRSHLARAGIIAHEGLHALELPRTPWGFYIRVHGWIISWPRNVIGLLPSEEERAFKKETEFKEKALNIKANEENPFLYDHQVLVASYMTKSFVSTLLSAAVWSLEGIALVIVARLLFGGKNNRGGNKYSRSTKISPRLLGREKGRSSSPVEGNRDDSKEGVNDYGEVSRRDRRFSWLLTDSLISTISFFITPISFFITPVSALMINMPSFWWPNSSNNILNLLLKSSWPSETVFTSLYILSRITVNSLSLSNSFDSFFFIGLMLIKLFIPVKENLASAASADARFGLGRDADRNAHERRDPQPPAPVNGAQRPAAINTSSPVTTGSMKHMLFKGIAAGLTAILTVLNLAVVNPAKAAEPVKGMGSINLTFNTESNSGAQDNLSKLELGGTILSLYMGSLAAHEQGHEKAAREVLGATDVRISYFTKGFDGNFHMGLTVYKNLMKNPTDEEQAIFSIAGLRSTREVYGRLRGTLMQDLPGKEKQVLSLAGLIFRSDIQLYVLRFHMRLDDQYETNDLRSYAKYTGTSHRRILGLAIADVVLNWKEFEWLVNGALGKDASYQPPAVRPYFDYNGDTVGIGITGSVDGLEPVFQKIKDLLNGKSTSSPVIISRLKMIGTVLLGLFMVLTPGPIGPAVNTPPTLVEISLEYRATSHKSMVEHRRVIVDNKKISREYLLSVIEARGWRAVVLSGEAWKV